MENCVAINIKPSDRKVKAFKRVFPNAQYSGAATLGSKSKCYYIPLEEYETRKDEIKKYGSKARHQPFLSGV